MTKEEERYNLQVSLDQMKSDKERNILGQFSTPYPLAKDMVRYVLSLPHEDEIRFLEPSIGTGVFYSALRDVVNPIFSVGYEIDNLYYAPTVELWKDHDLHLINGDFFNYKPSPDFNLILANPPYSRHHHIDQNLKKRLQALILEKYNVRLSGLSGLYCYFLILSTLWLKEDGISSWLIPSEFLDVNYGVPIKEFLCSKVELISIHKFNPADLQFSDALVSSSIVTFRNRKPTSHFVKFTSGSKLNSPRTSVEVPLKEIDPNCKWSSFFTPSKEIVVDNGLCLGEYFKVSRGVSTGNNSFFIITQKFATEAQLPSKFLTPILPPPRQLQIETIEEDLAGLNYKDKFFLLSCSLPIEEIKSSYSTLYDYIKEGEQKRMNSSYNCQRRNPWYSTETRRPAPIYMTYMGRHENSARMFRFILNHSTSIVTNSYLMLYPRDNYKHCFEDKKIMESVWRILNKIPKERLAKCGRTYGGGLFKIEPKELQSLMVPELKNILHPQQGVLFDSDCN